MKYTITGEIAQVARLEFEEGESVWASKGSIVAYSQGVEWEQRIPGGFGGAMRRSLAGEGLSLTFMKTTQPGQHALLAANAPGHIYVWDLADGAILTTRGAFLAAWGDDVDITVTVARRAGAAFFGGAGLFLQRLSGTGKVLVHGSGDFQERHLVEGENLLVSTGNLAAFTDSVDYDIQGVGSVGRALFGGEGFFMTRLTGPGMVLMQTLKRESGNSSAAS